MLGGEGFAELVQLGLVAGDLCEGLSFEASDGRRKIGSGEGSRISGAPGSVELDGMRSGDGAVRIAADEDFV